MSFQRIRAPYSPRACAINIGPTSYLQQRDERGIRGYAGQQEREPFIGIGNAPSGVNLSNCHGDTAGANHITAERYPP